MPSNAVIQQPYAWSQQQYLLQPQVAATLSSQSLAPLRPYEQSNQSSQPHSDPIATGAPLSLSPPTTFQGQNATMDLPLQHVLNPNQGCSTGTSPPSSGFVHPLAGGPAPTIGRPDSILNTTCTPPNDDRIDQMRALVASYGSKISRMTFEWRPRGPNGQDGWWWVPQLALGLRSLAIPLQAVVHEYNEGEEGELGLRIVEEKWGTAWRKNCETSFLRRRKIIKLVDEIKMQQIWSTKRTIEYLDSIWDPTVYTSSRQIAGLIEKKGKEMRPQWLAGAEKF
ncbi:hypothetical protein OIO90_002924 [Microbotryomycetes sp. JL221]|nr:hypothetical protein OIO90_002924 [Microbotryomycetes sp. JL221]